MYVIQSWDDYWLCFSAFIRGNCGEELLHKSCWRVKIHFLESHETLWDSSNIHFGRGSEAGSQTSGCSIEKVYKAAFNFWAKLQRMRMCDQSIWHLVWTNLPSFLLVLSFPLFNLIHDTLFQVQFNSIQFAQLSLQFDTGHIVSGAFAVPSGPNHLHLLQHSHSHQHEVRISFFLLFSSIFYPHQHKVSKRSFLREN